MHSTLAEFINLRRMLGFTPAEARFLIPLSTGRPVVTLAQWMQWENRLGPPPEYVMTVLLLLSAWMANEIELLRSQIDRSVAPDPLKPALLRISYADANDFSAAFGSEPIYFRPNEAVSAALLMLESQRVRLVHFDPLAYVRWKGDRADTVDLRDTWARLAFLAEADPVFDF